ncbi:uncharacterized protein LOC117809022 [Notolabrus celidotus]|uniref:uncharacterized protein LOC117809022 n=1 Tax=Notolabrus celidotus TaxID=1203425 RepID=UPI0014906D24|nr:uncharacterized protein LOC117809022 [Notolabrus celidotus]XP_034534584.1 uncharacterized protein LOC117809022 [Notolabrus celidotus]
MDSGAMGTIEVAALGRPFRLGMLYDCRKDSLVPGMTFWDYDDLKKHIDERQQNYNNFEIVASESIEDKSSALDVKASLKASFLGGLFEVDGSAKYLNDSKTSKNQARVTLKYKTTTKVQELSMNHLGAGNVKHQNVFEKGIATHVVTAILYGAQAFFVFDREVSQEEDHQDIEGNLKVVIRKIPCLAIDGEGSLKMEDKDKANVDKFSCSFFGDFSLKKMPTSFQEAIQVYKSLPELLGANGENAVPMKVWLLPLTALDSSAAKLVRQISLGLVKESQRVLEDFSELEMRCNDALRTTTVQKFPQIGKKVKAFKEMCSQFKLEFQQALAKTLPSIRGGGEEEAVLTEILKKIHSSPFNNEKLNEWMDCKEREIHTIMSLTDTMKNTMTVPSQNHLYKESLKPEHAVCFVFTSLGSDEPYLSALSNYLRKTPEPEIPLDPGTQDLENKQWYASRETADSMRKKAKIFSDFAEANQGNKNVRFLTAGIKNETQKGSSIYLYQDGFSVTEDFEPPSKPESVTVSDINHNSVTLKIDPPKFGLENITSYSVERCVSGEEGWKQQTASKAGEVTVGDLSPNTEYMFRCRAVTSVGLGPANQVSGPLQTLPCSPPGKPEVDPNSSEISVSWEKPAELGQDVHVLSYIVEHAKTDERTDNEVKEEDLQWKKIMTGAETGIISGLESETEYVVRVICDCGAAGKSKESITVNVCTTKQTLKDELKMKSQKVSSASPSVYQLPLEEEVLNMKGCRWFSFGKESMKPNCTIMLLGATGSGKSTLINGMMNFILGVNWTDNFRFKLIDEEQTKSQAESQTSEVTVYKINHQEVFNIDYSVTIVDTPGFGNTRGIERDREIVEQLRNLLSSDHGVRDIDAVGFVAQASLARLTPTQRYVFDSVLSIFGKDIAENIRILVTFADGQCPPVLEAINAADVPCPKTGDEKPVHFKFNNSALYANNKSAAADSMSGDEEDGSFDEMFWNMGTKSMMRFFNALNLTETKSLTMMKEVLRERKQLEVSVEGLQIQVKNGLAKLEEIKETAEKLKKHEAEISRNENFEFEIKVKKPQQVDISGSGVYLTNCQQCHYTCHDNCPYGNDRDKINCCAIGSDGKCRVCPGKCIWSVHFNQKYKWEYKEVTEKQTHAGMKKKYDIAKDGKSGVEAVIRKLKAEYDAVQTEVEKLMKDSVKCLNRLKEIALRPNPLSTPEYIDLLIEGEKNEGKPGWKNRVESLTDMRENADYMARVERGESPLQRNTEHTSQPQTFWNRLFR